MMFISNHSDSPTRELLVVTAAGSHNQLAIDSVVQTASASRTLEIVFLEGDRDDAQQIIEILARHRDLDAILLVNHRENAPLRIDMRRTNPPKSDHRSVSNLKNESGGGEGPLPPRIRMNPANFYRFGNTIRHVVSGFVINDSLQHNGNATEPACDRMKPGVTVRLVGTNDRGEAVDQITTVSSASETLGYFAFAGLRPSDAAGYRVYQVETAVMLGGASPPEREIGAIRRRDSDDAIEWNRRKSSNRQRGWRPGHQESVDSSSAIMTAESHYGRRLERHRIRSAC